MWWAYLADKVQGACALWGGGPTLTFISPKSEFKGTLQLLPMKQFLVSKSGLAHISAEARTCWEYICISSGLKGHFSSFLVCSVYCLFLRLFNKNLCTVTDSNLGAEKPPYLLETSTHEVCRLSWCIGYWGLYTSSTKRLHSICVSKQYLQPGMRIFSSMSYYNLITINSGLSDR